MISKQKVAWISQLVLLNLMMMDLMMMNDGWWAWMKPSSPSPPPPHPIHPLLPQRFISFFYDQDSQVLMMISSLVFMCVFLYCLCQWYLYSLGIWTLISIYFSFHNSLSPLFWGGGRKRGGGVTCIFWVSPKFNNGLLGKVVGCLFVNRIHVIVYPCLLICKYGIIYLSICNGSISIF
jgi:hypothetical protein